jgi:hypothetical protein
MTDHRNLPAPQDSHTGWHCDSGATLIADAMTPGPGKLGTLHGVIYACPEHQDAADERITATGCHAEIQPAPPSHQWNPWPCGHVTAFTSKATALTAEETTA